MLSNENKKKIFELREKKMGYKKISKFLNLTRDNVRNVLKSKCKLNCLKRGPKPRLNKTLKLRIKRCINTFKNNCQKINCSKVKNECNLDLSTRTLQRHMKTSGLYYKKIKRNIGLTDKDFRTRKECITSWISENHDWNVTTFSDEKYFKLDGPDNQYTYMYKNDIISKPLRQGGGGGVMVWAILFPNGLVSYRFIGRRFRSKEYTEILNAVGLPMCALNIGQKFYFQQDNAPIHNSRVTKEFFKSSDITVLKWPPRSPDLNICENIWQILSIYVYDKIVIKNIDQLKIRIEEAFFKINEKRSINQNLYTTYRKRLCDVLSSNCKTWKATGNIPRG